MAAERVFLYFAPFLYVQQYLIPHSEQKDWVPGINWCWLTDSDDQDPSDKLKGCWGQDSEYQDVGSMRCVKKGDLGDKGGCGKR